MESRQSMSDDRTPTSISNMDVAVFEAVTDHYKQDLREFFTRSNFYLAVQGALLSAFGIRGIPQVTSDYVVSIGIIVVGLALTAFWWIVASGSVFWIDLWREEVQSVSERYSSTGSYKRIEENARKYPRKSPERITRYLPLLFGLFWLTFAGAVVWNLMAK